MKLQKFTGHKVKVMAVNGANNFSLFNFIQNQRLANYDVLILGWSGVTRYWYSEQNIDFGWAENYKLRDEFFENKTLSNLENDFLSLNQEVDRICEINNVKKIIKFSVFGDFKYLWDDKFTDMSFLDFLAEKQGRNFINEIPFFEYDFLSEVNYKNTTNFAKKYFPKGWEQAIIERNDIRPGKYFLDCGHPNREGHKLWAEFIASKI
jgi:hypothetical protein